MSETQGRKSHQQYFLPAPVEIPKSRQVYSRVFQKAACFMLAGQEALWAFGNSWDRPMLWLPALRWSEPGVRDPRPSQRNIIPMCYTQKRPQTTHPFSTQKQLALVPAGLGCPSGAAIVLHPSVGQLMIARQSRNLSQCLRATFPLLHVGAYRRRAKVLLLHIWCRLVAMGLKALLAVFRAFRLTPERPRGVQ